LAEWANRRSLRDSTSSIQISCPRVAPLGAFVTPKASRRPSGETCKSEGRRTPIASSTVIAPVSPESCAFFASAESLSVV
jgi:hypothetical protein